jgi:hypothetical protein
MIRFVESSQNQLSFRMLTLIINQGEQRNMFRRDCSLESGPCTCKKAGMQGKRLYESHFVHGALICSSQRN